MLSCNENLLAHWYSKAQFVAFHRPRTGGEVSEDTRWIVAEIEIQHDTAVRIERRDAQKAPCVCTQNR